MLVDALVHAVRFVKGGVSMETLPTGGLAEVAFVGRSNVGKSSLVNMVLGRRAIAYTSKTPGKTQQYNYFAVNEGRAGVRKRGREESGGEERKGALPPSPPPPCLLDIPPFPLPPPAASRLVPPRRHARPRLR